MDENAFECTLFQKNEKTNTQETTESSHLHQYDSQTLVRCLLLAALKFRHKNMTYSLMEDFSKLLLMENCESEHLSKYKFKELIRSFSMEISIHHICNTCKKYVGISSLDTDGTDKIKILFCRNCEIEIDVKNNIKSGSVFFYLPLIHQLQAKFENAGDLSLYSRERKKKHPSAIEDIFDGRKYKDIKEENMITITFNIDGVPIFDSSNYSGLPVLCTINEVHPKQRGKNIMFTSVWCGTYKPEMTEYLKPFIEEARELYDRGFQYKYEGQLYIKRCRFIIGIFDSVARSMVQGTTQFNGKFGCGLCLHKGKRVPKGRGSVRIYPVDKDRNSYGKGLRNHAETLIHADNQTYGVKSRSILFDIPEFDVISGIPADWMHAVLLGVVRQFSKIWFQSTRGNKGSFQHLKETIDGLVNSYKPTLESTRIPQKISDAKKLKAYELCLWLLNYSLGTLKSIFPAKIFNHWSLLVDGISILLKTSIMKSEVYYAQQCLLQFVEDVKDLYGKEHLSYNVHLLTHMAESVLDWGPLFVHSAFIFEDFNQKILASIKSSNGVAIQICKSMRLQYAIDRMKIACNNDLTDRNHLYLADLLNLKQLPKSSLCVDGAKLIGEEKMRKFEREYILAFKLLDIDVNVALPVRCYLRAIVNDELIHTVEYKRSEKRASYFVILKDQSIFEITVFALVPIADTLRCFAIGKCFEKTSVPIVRGRRLEHVILLSKKLSSLAVVNVNEIQGKITIIENTKTKNIIATIPPNRIELLA